MKSSHNRFSSSSGTSQGSGDQVFYNRAPPGGPQTQQQGMSSISNNLNELDQLLSDLNSAQFLAEVDKKHPSTGRCLIFTLLKFEIDSFILKS